MLVKLRVNQSTFDDIRQRILGCGDPGEALSRFKSPREVCHPGPQGGIDLSRVVIVVDEREGQQDG